MSQKAKRGEKRRGSQVVPQQLQLSAEGLALSFGCSFMGSGNSLYSSTSVSWQTPKRVKTIRNRRGWNLVFVFRCHSSERKHFEHYSLVLGRCVQSSGMPVLRLWLLWRWSQSMGCCFYSGTKLEPFWWLPARTRSK